MVKETTSTCLHSKFLFVLVSCILGDLCDLGLTQLLKDVEASS
jgi:hypothetical protein